MTRIAVGIIRLYRRWVSRFLPRVCRFEPTCSTYAIGALQKHGFWRGSWLATKRICRCHPFSAGGHDPVPEPASRDDDQLASPDEGARGDADGRTQETN